MSFWDGFEKAATVGGVKSNKPSLVNKPTAMVSTQAAFKPAPLPTAKPHAVSQSGKAILPATPVAKTTMPKPIGAVVGDKHL